MAQTSLSYYEKVLKSKVARVRLYPAQDAGAFEVQNDDLFSDGFEPTGPVVLY